MRNPFRWLFRTRPCRDCDGVGYHQTRGQRWPCTACDTWSLTLVVEDPTPAHGCSELADPFGGFECVCGNGSWTKYGCTSPMPDDEPNELTKAVLAGAFAIAVDRDLIAATVDVDPEPTYRPRRYDQCFGDCTVDCGHCKGQGPPELAARYTDRVLKPFGLTSVHAGCLQAWDDYATDLVCQDCGKAIRTAVTA